ncbi:MAG: hypothetical protein R3C16_02155 [Hyphomonadaceae bacterium]
MANPIANCTGDFCWSPDSQFIFWIFRDDNGRPAKVYRRAARGNDDTLVYDEPDDGFFLSVGVTESRDFITIHAGHHASSETHLIPATTPTATPTLFSPREGRSLHTDTLGRPLVRADQR